MIVKCSLREALKMAFDMGIIEGAFMSMRKGEGKEQPDLTEKNKKFLDELEKAVKA